MLDVKKGNYGSGEERSSKIEMTTIIEPSANSNVFDKVTKFIDENIRVFRYAPWLIGSAGVLLLLGSANMFRRYRGTMSVPQRLIQSNMILRGRVVKVDHHSLYVWHTPLLRRLTRIGLHSPTAVDVKELINVQFSGVSIATSGAVNVWLNKTIGSPVELMMLYRNIDNQCIECIVHIWRRWFHYAPRRKYCVNEELVSLGLGTMIEPRGFTDTTASVNFLQQLARQERIAQEKGRGIWEGTDHVTSWNRMSQWVASKIGGSNEVDITRNSSIPISTLANDLSSKHRH